MKKICSVCLLINNDGVYNISCKSCNMTYYCSKTCQMYAQRKLNHAMICPLLRRLGTFKSDFHSKSIMTLLLNSLALRKTEEDYLKQKENSYNNGNKSEKNDNQSLNMDSENNWLSLVPLPSDIEMFEKEIENLEKKGIISEKESNKKQINNELNEIEEEKVKDDVSFSSDNENTSKNKKKDKTKKKDGKKEKKHRRKKEEENIGIDLNINNNNKEKSKHKHSKHHKKDENSNKEVNNENNSIKEEIIETNTDKYDLITNTIPYSGTFKDLMNLQSHYEEWTEGIYLFI